MDVDGIPDVSDFRGRPRRRLGVVPSGATIVGVDVIEVDASSDGFVVAVIVVRSVTLGMGAG